MALVTGSGAASTAGGLSALVAVLVGLQGWKRLTPAAFAAVSIDFTDPFDTRAYWRFVGLAFSWGGRRTSWRGTCVREQEQAFQPNSHSNLCA